MREFLSDIYFKGGVYGDFTNDSSVTTALFLNGTQVKKRTLGSMAFETASDYLSSIAVTIPTIFTPNTDTINTADPTLTFSLASQTANKVLASPDGLTGTPSFRALVSADMPSSVILGGGSGAANEVAFFTDTRTLDSNSSFKYDGTNLALGATPVAAGTNIRTFIIDGTAGGALQLNTNGVAKAQIYTDTSHTYLSSYGNAGDVIIGNSYIRVYGGATPTYRVLITGDTYMNGSVGIGVAPNTNKVYILGTSTTTAALRIEAPTATSANGGGLVINTPLTSNSIMFEASGVQKWIQYLDSSTNFNLYSNSTTANVISFAYTTGNIGIGATPSASSKALIQFATGASNVSILSLAKVQSTNDTGIHLKFAGGTSGTTNRGYIGMTHSGSGADTIFTGEIVDSIAIRSETALQFGTGGDNIRGTIFSSTGNWFFGSTPVDAGFKVDVNGSFRTTYLTNQSLVADATNGLYVLNTATTAGQGTGMAFTRSSAFTVGTYSQIYHSTNSVDGGSIFNISNALHIVNTGVGGITIYSYDANAPIRFATNGVGVTGALTAERMRIFGATGNLKIQSGSSTWTDAGYKLDIASSGTAGALRVQGIQNITADTLTTATNALLVTGTLPATTATFNSMVSFQATSASNGQNQYSLLSNLLAGGTDGVYSSAGRFSNVRAGSGTLGLGLFGGAANTGISVSATGGGATNIGGDFYAEGGTSYSIAGQFFANSATSSPVRVGVLAFAINSTSTAGYFGMHSQGFTPTFTNAALIADNGATTGEIFLGRDNGTPVFAIRDNGKVIINNGVTDHGEQFQLVGTSWFNGAATFASTVLITGVLTVENTIKIPSDKNGYLQLGRYSSGDNYGYVSAAGLNNGTGLKFETTASSGVNSSIVALTLATGGAATFVSTVSATSYTGTGGQSTFTGTTSYNAVNTGWVGAFHTNAFASAYGVRFGAGSNYAIIQAAENSGATPLGLQPFGGNTYIGVIGGSGKVGINQTSPASALHVSGSTSEIAIGSASASQIMYIGHSEGGSTSSWVTNIYNSDSATLAIRMKGNTSSNDVLRFLGTVSATFSVMTYTTVATSTSAVFNGADSSVSVGGGAGIQISNTNATTNNRAGVFFADSSSLTFQAAIQAKFTDRSNHYAGLVFTTKGTGSYRDSMYIYPDGAIDIAGNQDNTGTNSNTTGYTLKIASSLFVREKGGSSNGIAGTPYATQIFQPTGAGWLEFFNQDATNTYGIALGINGTLKAALTGTGTFVLGGNNTSSGAGFLLEVNKAYTGGLANLIRNTAAGTGNYAGIQIGNDQSANAAGIAVTSTTYTPSGVIRANCNYFYSTRDGGLSIAAEHASGIISFAAAGTTERMKITGTYIEMYGTGSFLRIKGTGAGNLNSVGLAFYESGGSRTGFVGDYTSGDDAIRLYSDGTKVGLSTSAGDALTITNLNAVFAGSVTGTSFIKTGGTSSEYLMADGSVSTGNTILTGSVTYDFPSASGGSTLYVDITVTGAAIGDAVALGIDNRLIGSCSYYPLVVSANTVRVYFENFAVGAQDPPSATYTVKVFK